jgi:hypothetical protein
VKHVNLARDQDWDAMERQSLDPLPMLLLRCQESAPNILLERLVRFKYQEAALAAGVLRQDIVLRPVHDLKAVHRVEAEIWFTLPPSGPSVISLENPPLSSVSARDRAARDFLLFSA